MHLYKAHVAERVSLPERFANPIDVDKSAYHHLSQIATLRVWSQLGCRRYARLGDGLGRYSTNFRFEAAIQNPSIVMQASSRDLVVSEVQKHQLERANCSCVAITGLVRIFRPVGVSRRKPRTACYWMR
jgi:hypothetical protein